MPNSQLMCESLPGTTGPQNHDLPSWALGGAGFSILPRPGTGKMPGHTEFLLGSSVPPRPRTIDDRNGSLSLDNNELFFSYATASWQFNGSFEHDAPAQPGNPGTITFGGNTTMDAAFTLTASGARIDIPEGKIANEQGLDDWDNI